MFFKSIILDFGGQFKKGPFSVWHRIAKTTMQLYCRYAFPTKPCRFVVHWPTCHSACACRILIAVASNVRTTPILISQTTLQILTICEYAFSSFNLLRFRKQNYKFPLFLDFSTLFLSLIFLAIDFLSFCFEQLVEVSNNVTINLCQKNMSLHINTRMIVSTYRHR